MLPINSKAPEYNQYEVLRMIEELDTCPLKNSGVRVVNPVGDGSSGIFLIGEAPGAKEDLQGEPFVGAAGKFLNNKLLPTVGLTRKNIYLTNIVKCRPPQNRDPLPEEKEAWSFILLAELIAQKPNLVVCLGRHSMGFFLTDKKISQVHGTILKVKIFEDFVIDLLPMYHPAVALYSPSQGQTLINDFQIIKKYLKNTKINDNSEPNNEKDISPDLDGSLF